MTQKYSSATITSLIKNILESIFIQKYMFKNTKIYAILKHYPVFEGAKLNAPR